MDIEKFTERARGFLQAAQTIAIREFHQRITPQHLLKALLDDEEGAAAGLIKAAGGDPEGGARRGRGRSWRASPRCRGPAPASRSSRPNWCGCSTPRSRPRPRPATSMSRRTGCWSRSPPPTRRPARALRSAGANAAGAGEGGQRHPQGPQGHQPERRIQLRRAEEVRPRHDRARARRQARSGDRPRRGDPPHHPGAGAPHQEQPGADRRARASARPPSSRASRCASSTATCRRR